MSLHLFLPRWGSSSPQIAPAGHQDHLCCQPHVVGMVLHHVLQPSGFVPLGKLCPWGKVTPGGEHRGPPQLRSWRWHPEQVGVSRSTRTWKAKAKLPSCVRRTSRPVKVFISLDGDGKTKPQQRRWNKIPPNNPWPGAASSHSCSALLLGTPRTRGLRLPAPLRKQQRPGKGNNESVNN